MKTPHIHNYVESTWVRHVPMIAPLQFLGRTISAKEPVILEDDVEISSEAVSVAESKVISAASSALIAPPLSITPLTPNVKVLSSLGTSFGTGILGLIASIREFLNQMAEEASSRAKPYPSVTLDFYQRGTLAIQDIVTNVAKSFSKANHKLNESQKEKVRLDELRKDKKAEERRQAFRNYSVETLRLWHSLQGYLFLKPNAK